MNSRILHFRLNKQCCSENEKKELSSYLVPSNDRPCFNGSSDEIKNYSGPAFKARPLKHYRKRLIPNNQVKSSKPTIIFNDKPGLAIYSNTNQFSNKDGMVRYSQRI